MGQLLWHDCSALLDSYKSRIQTFEKERLFLGYFCIYGLYLVAHGFLHDFILLNRLKYSGSFVHCSEIL